ncbi:hypothetical protein BDF19DRAFT_450654 [Syncephalis fuscata]|nr:hypothetical protein BDF19DRAFT_450654 [Syncephalis fuscata]
MAGLTEDESAVLNWCALITSSLGTLGALAIIVSYHISARFRTPIARIMYFNAYGEFMGCIGQAIGFFAITFPAEHPLCQYQSAILQTGLLWGVIGDSLIGISLLLIVIKHVSLKRIRKLNNILFTIIAVISVLNGFVPLLVYSTNSGGLLYGPMVGWCWLTSNYTSLQFIQLHLPICAVFISNTVIFIWVGIVYYRRYLKRFSMLAILFTIIYILCWLSVFINRLLAFAGITIYFMFILRNVCTPLRGLFNLVLFSVMAISTNITSPSPISKESNMYKLHLISDDEPPSPCRPIYEIGKTYQVSDNLYPYITREHIVSSNC